MAALRLEPEEEDDKKQTETTNKETNCQAEAEVKRGSTQSPI